MEKLEHHYTGRYIIRCLQQYEESQWKWQLQMPNESGYVKWWLIYSEGYHCDVFFQNGEQLLVKLYMKGCYSLLDIHTSCHRLVIVLDYIIY